MYIVTVDCARSNKHKLRLLYVDVCKFVMELFSKSFFKQHFCEALLELAGVSMSNTCNNLLLYVVVKLYAHLSCPQFIMKHPLQCNGLLSTYSNA